MEFDPKIFAVAKELNRQDNGGIRSYEWEGYDMGRRDPDTTRHINRYIERAKVILKALT